MKRLPPMLATLSEAPFDDEEWIFETKWDGFRALAQVGKEGVDLYSRNLQPFNARFPTIVRALQKLKISALLDGEIVALDAEGRSHFQDLQNAREENVYYYVFDLLYLDSRDLRSLPLIERKALLQKILRPLSRSCVRYCPHIEGKGGAFFAECVEKGLEGMIAKRRQSLYLSGKRSRMWLKIKTSLRQEALICGFTQPRGARKELGALILGLSEGDHLRFAGRVGTGFTAEKLAEIKRKLTPLVQKTSPFRTSPRLPKGALWVKPHYVCEVSFREWTKEGLMRQPVYIGLRTDKKPPEVTKEEKIFWPKEGITKGDLLDYYRKIAPWILPYLKQRPQALRRFPDGIQGKSFFQKNLATHPDWVQTVEVHHASRTIHYLLIEDEESLLYAVNLGCIELHPFLSRLPHLDRPDFLLIDLDPEAIPFEAVIETALKVHEILEALQIEHHCKTSGARGLHICIPLGARLPYPQVQAFAQEIAHHVHGQLPKITSLERSPRKRQGRVYVDVLQNRFGQTMAAPYSVRALPGAPVSTPLTWEEVKKGLDPHAFTLHTIQQRLKKRGDLFKPLLGKGVDLKRVLARSFRP